MNSAIATSPLTRPRVEFAALSLMFLAVFFPFAVGLVQDWNNRPDASHGWLVLPVALWIAWTRRKALENAPAQVFTPALGIVIFGLIGAIVSARASLTSVGYISIMMTLNGLLLYHLGWPRFRVVAFPALFLFLMIPLPVTITGAITFPLQQFASRAAELCISLIGIPVQRMGNVLTLPGGSLEVAEACSGLRSAMTFVTLGALTAWLTPGAVRKALVLILALPFALLANVIRITATGVLVQFFGPAAAQGTPHEAVGMGAFLIGLALYAASTKALGSRWSHI